MGDDRKTEIRNFKIRKLKGEADFWKSLFMGEAFDATNEPSRLDAPIPNEMTWRFDNRKNPFLFRDTLKRMLDSDNLEFKELTAA